jgi:hypothetical protein
MIRVNLLPPDARKSSSGLSVNLPWKKAGAVLLAAVAVASAWLLIMTPIQSSRLNRLTLQWNKMKSERAQVEKVDAAVRAFQNRATMLKEVKAPGAQWAPRLNLLSDALVSKLWFHSLEYMPSGGAEKSSDKQAKRRQKRENAQAEAAAKKEANKEKASAGKKGAKAGKKPVAAKQAPSILLKGSFLDTGERADGSPVNRYLHRLKEHPDFQTRFRGVRLKTVEHRQVGKEEVSDFVIELFPKGQ